MGKKMLRFCLAALLVLAGISGYGQALEDMHVYYLDVGQAESTVLLGPDFTVLIDAGDPGDSGVLEHLQRLGVDAIDLFIVTHLYADHMDRRCGAIAFSVAEVDVRLQTRPYFRTSADLF